VRISALDGRRIASAGLCSLAAHLVLLATGGVLLARVSLEPPAVAQNGLVAPPSEHVVEVDLPEISEGSIAGEVVELPEVAVPRGGGEATPRPDTGTRGRGGEDTGAPATNLADRDDERALVSEIPSRIDRTQVQRIDAGERRASREDWRASRTPMELTFLASGRSGSRPERRQYAVHDPSSGGRQHGRASELGGALGREAEASEPLGVKLSVGGAEQGVAAPSEGIGVRDGVAGKDARASAEVPLARPWVPEGTPSVPADSEGRPQDNVDSEQEVALAMQSIVRASTAGGAPGQGSGGQAGPGKAGSGGERGAQSTADALGTGHGDSVDASALDRRRTDYLRRVLSRIHPLWKDAFPKWAIAEGLGGTVVVSFVISANGSVATARVSRSSGIPEFDENCRKAVLRGAPFDPLPAELGQKRGRCRSSQKTRPFVREIQLIRERRFGRIEPA
jgi:TonB family protein